MQSSELESGLPDEAEQEGIVSFCFFSVSKARSLLMLS